MGDLAPKDKNQDPTGSTPPADPENGGENEGGNSKTFSQEEVNEIVSKRINEVKSKSEETIAQKIQEALVEQERKQKLSDEERLNEERKARNDELAQKERDIALRENRADARELLQQKGISAELVDFLVDADAKKTTENIEAFAKVFDKAVEASVEKKVAGNTPKDTNPAGKPSDGGKRSTADLLYKKK